MVARPFLKYLSEGIILITILSKYICGNPNKDKPIIVKLLKKFEL